MATVVRLRGTDITKEVLRSVEALVVEEEIGSRIRICSLPLDDTSTARPEDGDYLEVTKTDGVTARFRGLVRFPSLQDEPGVRVIHRATAQDWGALLSGILVTGAHSWAAGTSDGKMVSDLVSSYWAPVASSASHVIRSRRATMPAMSIAARSKSLRKALDDIAIEAFGAPYYVDPLKGLHWNDVHRLAAFALGDKPAADGDALREVVRLTDQGDAGALALRIKVKGAGGVEYEATDFNEWGRLARKQRDEAGSPGERFYQLPDETDTALTTVDECRQRAWARIEEHRRRRVLKVWTYEEGLAPGMQVDLFDSAITFARPPRRQSRGVCPTKAVARARRSVGRFMIQRVVSTLVGADDWLSELDLGSYVPNLAVTLVKLEEKAA